MKIRPGDVDGLCERPPGSLRAILLYGPDRGLVAERLRRATRAIVGEDADRFRSTDLDADEVWRHPERLLDGTAQLSLDGGARAVRIRNAGDRVTDAVKAFLDGGGGGTGAGAGDATVLVEAGDLRPASRLRKLFEGRKDAAAAPSYADDPGAVARLVDDMAREARVEVEPQARTYLAERLGRDRGVTRSELEKVLLYAGRGGRVSYEEALTLTGDNALLGMSVLADAAGLGRTGAAFRALARLEEDGVTPVALVRGLLRHFQALHRVSGEGDAAGAVRGLRPPVHFRRTRDMVRQAERWRPQALERALAMLTRAEALCKRSGIPDRTVVRETVLRIARLASAK